MADGTPVTVTIVTSPYISVDDAQSYFDTRLRSDAWDDASVSDRTKALATATRSIDRLNFIRYKADDNQPNEFPRVDQTSIPQDILLACCEEALALLDDTDPEFEMSSLGNTTTAYAQIKDSNSLVAENIRAGIMSFVAWNFLKPWLADSNAIQLVRV